MLQRTVTILVGAPLALAIVFWPGAWPLTAAVGILTVASLREFYDACRRAGAAPADGFGYVAALVLLTAAVPALDPAELGRTTEILPGPSAERLLFFGLSLLVISSLAAELGRPERSPLRNLGPTWLGVVYIGWLFPFTARIRWLGADSLAHVGWTAPPSAVLARVEPGAWLLLYVLLLTWATDTFAYLVGKSLGRHKMAPVLSPGKTWEGCIGGFLGAMAIAALVGIAWLRLPTGFALAAGALVGLAAQLGDLCKSAFKRELGIKDFGALLPGHGGILDRFDSLLFTATVVYFLWLFWPGG